MSKVRLFCSYAHVDRTVVQQLAADLRHYDIWYDDDLNGGEDWWAAILSAIETCDVCLFLVSPESVESVYCRTEIAYAQQCGKPILPVLVGGEADLVARIENLESVQCIDAKQLADKRPAADIAQAVANLIAVRNEGVPAAAAVRPARPTLQIELLARNVYELADLTPRQQAQLASELDHLRSFAASEATRQRAAQLLGDMRASPHLAASVHIAPEYARHALELGATPPPAALGRAAPIMAAGSAGPIVPPRLRPAWRWWRLVVGIIVLTTIGIGLWLLLADDDDGPPPPHGRILYTSDRDCHPEIEVLESGGTPRTLADSGWLAAWSPDGSRVAFVSDRDGDDEIYTIRADGSGLAQLTFNEERDLAPAWSPDGTQIVFMASRDGANQVYIMNADGSNPHKAFDANAEGADDPVWSPDGTQIAFTAWHDGRSDIYVATLATHELRRVTTGEFNEYWASWSPDGTQIAFAGWDDAVPGRDGSAGNFDIYIIGVDGSGQQQLTADPADDARPVWSPDGDWIVFESNREGNYNLYSISLPRVAVDEGNSTTPTRLTESLADERWASWMSGSGADAPVLAYHAYRECGNEIYLLDLNTGETARLTRNAVNDWLPTWSPDGTQIAYASQAAGSGDDDIYLMNADGTNARELTAAPGSGEWHPSWSPDGTRIAFHSNRDGDWEIFVLRLEDRHLDQITTNNVSDYDPVWSPDGTRIAYKSDASGNNEIYVMNADGSEPVPVTQNPGDDWLAAWSPDGTRIAYSSERGAGYDIYVVDLDTLESTPLVTDPARDVRPAWSPDGAWIAFESNRDGQNDLYALYIKTRRVVRLTDDPSWEGWPSWGE